MAFIGSAARCQHEFSVLYLPGLDFCFLSGFLAYPTFDLVTCPCFPLVRCTGLKASVHKTTALNKTAAIKATNTPTPAAVSSSSSRRRFASAQVSQVGPSPFGGGGAAGGAARSDGEEREPQVRAPCDPLRAVVWLPRVRATGPPASA